MPHESLASGNGAETPAVVVFRITDTGEVFHVEARPGVTTVATGGPARADAVVALPERLWLELLLGVKGVGEPPTVVSTAAILSAVRAATGRRLTRVPVRPDDICL